ncbi:hypothetical protein Tco_0746774 [Tanacetum coccineum]
MQDIARIPGFNIELKNRVMTKKVVAKAELSNDVIRGFFGVPKSVQNNWFRMYNIRLSAIKARSGKPEKHKQLISLQELLISSTYIMQDIARIQGFNIQLKNRVMTKKVVAKAELSNDVIRGFFGVPKSVQNNWFRMYNIRLSAIKARSGKPEKHSNDKDHTIIY